MKAEEVLPDERAALDGTKQPASGTHLEQVVHELVAANRILYRQGVVDAFGHVSVRHPQITDAFLIASSKAPALVSAEHIVELDLDGQPLGETSQPLYLERFIHGEIYRARPDVGAIVHSHSPSVLPFSVVPTAQLRPICHMSGFLAPGAPVFEIRDEVGDASDLLISTPDLGKALAATLGARTVVLMRGHGSTVVGSSLREAVFHAIYTEINARLQREASTLGSPVFLSAQEAAACVATVSASTDRAWNLWIDQI